MIYLSSASLHICIQVLQSNNPKTTLYGAANATVPGDTLTLSVDPPSALSPSTPRTTIARNDGSWSMTIAPLAPSTEPMTLVLVSSKTGVNQTLKNVLRGNVYVCSGQSNMALSVNSGYLPLTASEVETQAAQYPHIRLLNNGHFWPPTPSHPGGTPLGAQTGDPAGWQVPTTGNGSTASPGTVANFSAVCWFMGTTLSDYHKGQMAIGLISTDAGGTSIHRWVDRDAASQCSQITPTSSTPAVDNSSIGQLFVPMVLPLAQMAISGFTWYVCRTNERSCLCCFWIVCRSCVWSQ